MTIDFHEDKTKGGRGYVELPIYFSSILNIQTKIDILWKLMHKNFSIFIKSKCS